ncbi:outer membrane lipoprotein-sorting protein [Cytobacillus eiseniae]|uniref:Outer membrane lipoprotein-sorting protein n=1 Tax=Cytobacillus eiseniae TaxID=762947 RepID=A0ABS4RBV9_9BACI|nr:outer membrane lipoprotein-sorting protein [Cytobacillus eiseniae]
MKMKVTILAISLISIVLAGCGQSGSNDEAALKVDNITELVNTYSTGDIQNETASITSHELIVNKEDGDELIYDLSDEDFFVSIAPYVDQTHP